MTCNLCQKNKPLVESHIIPEFFYGNIYEEDIHRFKVLHTHQNRRQQYLQKGVKEPLMCSDCDGGIIGNYLENYIRPFLYGPSEKISTSHWRKINRANLYRNLFPDRPQQSPQILTRKQRMPRWLYFHDIDYGKFKLFSMSILWRAAISTNELFSQVDLNGYEEKLRFLIYNQKAPTSDFFPLFLIAIEHEGQFQADFITEAIKLQIKEFPFIRFTFGGFSWFFCNGVFNIKSLTGHFLFDSDHIIAPVVQLSEMENMKILANKLRNLSRI